ncbi:MAG: hypothetical protein P8P74_09220 [Crocinitomicaceae bacterium]|nr:hypothetical protein [Crocinitomicaceae bacterium]
MKTTIRQGIFFGSIIFGLHACQVQDDSIGIDLKSKESKEKSSALTCEDLFNTPEDFEGKVVTLDAINWGHSPSADGEEILMSIDDEALLQGLQQAHILVHFTKEQKEELKTFEENDSISLTAKVGTIEYGALRLIEAKVNPN